MSELPRGRDLSDDVRSLLASLQADGADPASAIRQWQAKRRSNGEQTVLRRAALTRRFDEALFHRLCVGVEAPPTFEAFIGFPEVRTLPRGAGFVITDDATMAALDSWPEGADRSEWNAILADYVQQHEPGDVVSRLCYLLRADVTQARTLFEQEFARAETKYDIAQCFALLEVLAQEQKGIGSALALSLEAHQQRYRALTMYASDYYRTRTYQQRSGMLEAIESLLAGSDHWMLRLHATGGMGKTMFLRWFVAEQLLARRIGCARVDFDDVIATNVARHPWLLLLPFAEQLNTQLAKTYFSEIVDQLAPLRPYLFLPTAESHVRTPDTSNMAVTPEDDVGIQLLRKFSAILREAGTQVVLILDTLEGVTLTGGIAPIFTMLNELHEQVPTLRVVFSGRYNIHRKLDELVDKSIPLPASPTLPILPAVELLDQLCGSGRDLELTPFSAAEASKYLKSRGITDPTIVEAIITKIGSPVGEHAQVGCSPFTLSLFADLVLGRDAITVEAVRAMPSSHFVYLVERVVKRIAEQPLRWVVRYGVLPRRLTPEFVAEVLRSPLEEALNGRSNLDQLGVQTRGRAEIREPDLWIAEPSATTDQLWEDLCRYEAPRGWIWRVAGERAVQFHGDVVEPMRDLLSSQPIFSKLQRLAIAYFERRASAEAERWADWTCEAIFHRFQLAGDAADAYWTRQLQTARTKGSPAWRRQIAREVLRREYADDETEPLMRGEPPVPLVSVQTLARGHIEAAHAILDESGFPTTAMLDWAEFKRHVITARRIIAATPTVTMPPVLDAQFDAAELVGKDDHRAAKAVLSEALRAAEFEARFGLELHMAYVCDSLRDPRTPEHYIAALSSHPGLGVTAMTVSDVHLSLARWYSSEGDAQRATKAYESALLAADDVKTSLSVRLEMAWEALWAWDLDRAAALISEAKGSELDDARFKRLQAWLSLTSGDPNRAFTLGTDALSSGAGVREEAFSRDLLAKTEAERMNFSRAFAEWETTLSLYPQIDVRNAVESCLLDRLVVESRVIGNYSAAATSVTQLLRLPGMRDEEIGARFHVEKLLLETQMGLREAAHETYRQLREPRQPPWPAVLRARVLCHGLALGLARASEATVDELIDLLKETQPASARIQLFEAFRYRKTPFKQQNGRNRLVEHIPPRPREGSAIAALHEAEVLRVCGEKEAAASLLWTAFGETLDRGNVWGAVQAWQGLRRLRRQNTRQWRVAEFMESSTPFESFGGAVLALEVAADSVSRQNKDTLLEQLDRLHNVLEQHEVLTRWHALLPEVRCRVAASAGLTHRAHAEAQIARSVYESLGDLKGARRAERSMAPPKARKSISSPRPTPPSAVARQELVAPPRWIRVRDLKALEALVSYGEYDALAERLMPARSPFLTELLPHAIDPIALERELDQSARFELPPGPVAALPWEWLYPPGRVHRARVTSSPIARETTLWIQTSLSKIGQRVLVDGHWGPETAAAFERFAKSQGLASADLPDSISAREVSGLRRYMASLQASQPEATVLVVKPRTENNFAFSQVSHEANAGFSIERRYADRVHGRRVETMESPRWVDVQERIETTRPAIVHIICAVTEQRRVPFLSFERGRQDVSNLVTARYLCDMVRAKKRTGPFVVLDVARPKSDWETMRCLLLRNHFATELLGVDGVSGVLATGLAQPWDVERQADILTRSVSYGSSQQELAAAIQKLSVQNEGDFDRRVAFGATALFSSEPELPCDLVS